MKTPGMMICERSIQHKAEAHFHPFASQLREWYQQKQQWLLQLKLELVCQQKYCSEKVVNWIPHGFNPIQYICRKRVADLILDP